MEQAAADPGFAPDPLVGRVFAVSRSVRQTDVAPTGRLRLDSLARYLQEAAEDDVAEAGWVAPYDWLLRRCAIRITEFPVLGDRLQIRTFCSATGPRWAQRATTVAGQPGDLIQAQAIWVAVSRDTGSPVPLGADFHELYGPSTQGRRISARLTHPGPPDTAPGRPWPLRAVDFDTGWHVNNAVYWAAAEDALAAHGWLPGLAELEYHRPAVPDHDPRLVSAHTGDQLSAWLMDGDRELASARLVRGRSQP